MSTRIHPTAIIDKGAELAADVTVGPFGIIENNVISDSKCTGVTLGKDRRSGHNVCAKNPGKDGARLYNEVIIRALENGWSKETIGSHIVRNNTIFNCEQAGICGSLGAVFSQITDNYIHDIWTKWQFEGDEIADHAVIRVLRSEDVIYHGSFVEVEVFCFWFP